jgi:hypothetical protein
MEKQTMKTKKPKLSLIIEDNKVTLTMEGGVPANIAQVIPDLIASALPKQTPQTSSKVKDYSMLIDSESWTVREKVRYIVLKHCRHGWFTSRDVKELFDKTFHPTISLPTSSTYLSRMYKEGSLTRRGSSAQREYRVNVEELADEISSILATK